MFLNFVGDRWGSLSIHPNVMVVTHFNFSRYPISREAPKFFPFSITVHLPIEYHFQYETICWWMNPRSLNQWIDPVELPAAIISLALSYSLGDANLICRQTISHLFVCSNQWLYEKIVVFNKIYCNWSS